MVLTSDFRSGSQRERLRRSLFCCLLRVAGKGKGAPVRAPPAGGSRPSRPLGLRASPLPTLCGGGAAARPACLRQSGKCGGWSPPPSRLAAAAAAQRRRRLRSARLRRLPAASRSAGHPSRKARPSQAACGGPCFAPSPRSVRRRCSGAARPPRCGGFGAVRASGPGGGAPASLASAATAYGGRPCRSALPTHSPPGVAALPGSRCRSSLAPRQAARQALAPLRAASSLRGASAACSARAPAGVRNLYRRAHWRRQAPPSPRFARGGARGTPPAGGLCRPVCRPARPRQAPRRRLRRPCGGLACRYPGQRGPTVAGVPPCAGLPPLLILVKRWCFLCLLLLVVCLAPVASGGWSAGLLVSLAGRLSGLLGLSGRPLWRRRLPVSWRRFLPPAPSGLLVLLLVGWLLSVAGSVPLWVLCCR